MAARALALLALVGAAAATTPIRINDAQMTKKVLRGAAGARTAGSAEADLITELPGFKGPFPSKQYSGYLNVDESHGRNLHYWFVESESDPAKDPIVLWLNGGPGCSSLDGFWYEQGPLHFKTNVAGGEIVENPNRWTKLANMIFLEAPAGVGFSYSDDQQDYNTNDVKTAIDNYHAIVKFIERFPQYADNEFYVAGESYAGIYVPTLTQQIVEGNKAGKNPKVNIKGYLVGNGVTDDHYDGNSEVPFLYGHGLISQAFKKNIDEVCKGTYGTNPDPKCQNAIAEAENLVGNVNIYDIYLPCFEGPAAEAKRAPGDELRGEWRKVMDKTAGRPENKAPAEYYGVPCISSVAAHALFNTPEVRKAIHVESEQKIGEWTICSRKLNYHGNYTTVMPIHKYLHENGLRALIYSGDVDSCIPYVGTEAWTSAMGYKVVNPWHVWSVDGQVAGYTTEYENNFIFTTVKGSGHMVPQFRPVHAFEMFKRFVIEKKAP